MKKKCEKEESGATCWSHESHLYDPRQRRRQLAAVDTDDIVVSTAASSAFFTRRARCVYTRAPASTRRRCRRANTSDEAEASSCGCAIRACGKDIQSVGRVMPRENEDRLAQTKRTRERERERKRERKENACCMWDEERKRHERRQGEQGIHLVGKPRSLSLFLQSWSAKTAERGRAISRARLALVVVVEIALAVVIVR